MKFIGLDIETAPTKNNPQVYALQPWRVKAGESRITCLSVSQPGRSPELFKPPQFAEVLNGIRESGYCAVTWNGVFDISFLLASGYDSQVERIEWFDAMLLWKWVDNGQRKEMFDPNWSLVDGAKRWLKGEPWLDVFLKLKANEPPAGTHDKYWERRAQLDALATRKIAERVWAVLTSEQRTSAHIEARCLVPTARSWINGVAIDVARAKQMEPAITDEMAAIERSLGVHNGIGTGWTPSTVLRSPVKLRKLLYEEWALRCDFRTPKGAPATDKAALTYLADYSSKATEILRWRTLNTQYSKFIQGSEKTYDYLGSDIVHPSPRLFSTYTGRMTYATKSGSKGEASKARIGLPLHQWPRLKQLRRLIIAPDGKVLVQFDAAGQEMRLIASQSGDVNMLKLFNSPPPYDDVHGFVGSNISGMSFENFLQAKADGVEAVVGPTGYRYQAKFTNLSCIAEGTEVLTDSGWKPIESITLTDKVFDGVEYVSHSGVISRGKKPVIRRGNIAATADHAFLDRTGRWMDWGEVWSLDSLVRALPRSEKQPVCGLSLRLQERSQSPAIQPHVGGEHTLPIMWDTSIHRRRKITDPSLSRNEIAMQQPERSQLPSTRSTRHQGRISVSERVCRLHQRDSSESRLSSLSDSQARYEQGFRAWESVCAGIQQKRDCVVYGRGDKVLPHSALSESDYTVVSHASGTGSALGTYRHVSSRDARNGSDRGFEAQTFDILDCGPRHRFVVRGGFIAHNCMYRIGLKKLRVKARVDYGMDRDILTVKRWRDTYFRSFKGIRRYWGDAIRKAQYQGFAESYGGRRFKLEFWQGDREWGTQQSAINFPVQGSGADMKELALMMLSINYPELQFAFDLHDGLFFYADITPQLPKLLKDAQHTLNNLPYEKMWGWKPPAPILWDCTVGKSWAKMRDL